MFKMKVGYWRENVFRSRCHYSVLLGQTPIPQTSLALRQHLTVANRSGLIRLFLSPKTFTVSQYRTQPIRTDGILLFGCPVNEITPQYYNVD